MEEIKLIENLFRVHFNKLCYRSFRITHDAEISADIVQEVFLKIWTQKEHFLKVENKEAYLIKAVLNGSLNFLESNKRKVIMIETLSRGMQEGHSENIYEFKELQQRVQSAINMLPEACKKVFLLSRNENMSYNEIAAMLSISVNTVEKHMVKALRILRENLEIFFVLLAFL